MILKIKTYPQGEGRDYERNVHCDVVHIDRAAGSINYTAYLGGKLVETGEYDTRTDIFLIEGGKTVDSWRFKGGDAS